MKRAYMGLLCVPASWRLPSRGTRNYLPRARTRRRPPQPPEVQKDFPKWDVRGPHKSTDFDELILERLEKPNDNASLIAYLKEVSPSDDNLLNIPALIEPFGRARQAQRNEASQRRVALGLPALWPVRRAIDREGCRKSASGRRRP